MMPNLREAAKLDKIIVDYLRDADRFTVSQAVDAVLPKARMACAKRTDTELREYLRARIRGTLEARQPDPAAVEAELARRMRH
jgi:hypothetical protein